MLYATIRPLCRPLIYYTVCFHNAYLTTGRPTHPTEKSQLDGTVYFRMSFLGPETSPLFFQKHIGRKYSLYNTLLQIAEILACSVLGSIFTPPTE